MGPISSYEKEEIDAPEPDILAIRLVDSIAQASRESAHRLVSEGIADNLLRSLRILPQSTNASSSQQLNSKILFASATLKFYRTLARYGIYANAPSLASDVLSSLSHFVLSLHGLPPSDLPTRVGERAKAELTCAWLDLLDIWMVCAKHPHCTSPPHAIRWREVVLFRWSMDIFDIGEVIFRPSAQSTSESAAAAPSMDVALSFWNAVSAWLEGSAVNGEWGGRDEKEEARSKLIKDDGSFGEGMKIIEDALGILERSIHEVPSHTQELSQVSIAARTLNAAVRLASSLLPTERASEGGTVAPEPHPPISIPIPVEKVAALCRQLAEPNKLLARGPSSDPNVVFMIRNITTLLVSTLRLSHAVKYGSPKEWITLGLQVLGCLVPGDEEDGAWIVSTILGHIGSQAGASLGWKIPEEVWTGSGLTIISPFLECALLAQDEPASGDDDENELDSTMVPVHLAPVSRSPETIATSTRIMFPPIREVFRTRNDGSVGKFGLPIEGGWVFSSIDELLRSGSSKAFKMLPRDWSSSEADVVRATLVFAGLFHAIVGGGKAYTLNHSEVVFACIKVFMLEHGQKQQDSGEEVYRDTFINNAMLSLLSTTRSASPPPLPDLPSAPPAHSSRNPIPPLERVARRLLGPRTPFYQMYTDFVALYDAISFSEPLFGALLIPPLSMSYAIDYRKLLWVDYAHLIRSIRTEPTHPVFGAAGKDGRVGDEYLYPLEKDGQVLNAYIGSLCGGSGGGGVHGILKTIAIHHVACHIWPDIHPSRREPEISEQQGAGTSEAERNTPSLEGSEAEWEEDRAKKLLMILVHKAPHDVIRAVILYSTPRSSLAILSNETRAERMEYVATWGGEALRGRLYALLKAAD